MTINIQSKYFWMAATALLLIATNGICGDGTYVILEESFETPVVTNSTKVDVEGWDREHDYTQLETENASTNVPTPYGSQFYSLWSQTGIKTTNITDTLQPGVTYTLTFNVGNGNSDGNPAPVGNNYRAEILAGTNVVASTTGVTDSKDFSIQAVVTLTTTGSDPHLGKNLGVRIAHDGPDWHYKTYVDNVKLQADESASQWKHTMFSGK